MAKDNDRCAEMVQKLQDTVRGQRRLIVLGHDNPDPDFLASALALKHLLRQVSAIPVSIACGGVIGRAENRAMVRLLKIKLTPIAQLHYGAKTAVVLIDTQPGTGNNSLPPNVDPAAVIDHHPRRWSPNGCVADIRSGYGATSTILTEYILSSGADIPSSLATALAYGILSETQDLSRETGEHDINAYLFTLGRANKRLLAQIIHPKVSRYYFTAIGRALNSAFYYRNIIGARLGDVSQPDVIAQVADLLLSHERMSWAICTGFSGDLLLISVRSSNPHAHLGSLMRNLVHRQGTAGGHELSAGAQINCRDMVPAERIRLEEGLILDFLHRITHQKEIDLKPLIGPP